MIHKSAHKPLRGPLGGGPEDHMETISKKQKLAEPKITKSIFITDTRNEGDLGKFTNLYEFDKSMVPDRVWKALMVLEEKGKFNFPNVGDSGYHALVDNVKDRKSDDEDFQEFFNLAMEVEHEWPRKGSTREQSMKQLANCSWVVHLVEE